MARTARAEMRRTSDARKRADFEAYTRLKELASISEDEKWENGAPEVGLQTVVALAVGVCVVLALSLTPASSSGKFPYLLLAVPFMAVYAAFVYGAYPHGTQKQRVDAATALVGYLVVMAVWLAARQVVTDEQLLRGIDAFAIFGQLASFLASIKESVLAWIAPTQFLVLTTAGKKARKAQRELNGWTYVPEDPDEAPIPAAAEDSAPTDGGFFEFSHRTG